MYPLAKSTQSNEGHINTQDVVAATDTCFSAILITEQVFSLLVCLSDQSVGPIRAKLEIY